MASITPEILQNNQRQDGTWLVVYRLTHKRKSVYIKTSHSISKAHLNKDNTIKQKYVIDFLSDDKFYDELIINSFNFDKTIYYS